LRIDSVDQLRCRGGFGWWRQLRFCDVPGSAHGTTEGADREQDDGKTVLKLLAY